MNDMTPACFDWQTQVKAASLLDATLAECATRCPMVATLTKRLLTETGTRFSDWVDHVCVPPTQIPAWRAAGFIDMDGCLQHRGGRFPRVTAGPLAVAISAESVENALTSLGGTGPIAGDPGPGLRRARLAAGDGADLYVVERVGSGSLVPTSCTPPSRAAALHHLDQFRHRVRDAATGFAQATCVIAAAIADLGIDTTCALFFAAERDYWQGRNTAARVQKSRQDAVGLGWANHDHHTYRSSRRAFSALIACLEMLGFTCRERFYAGREAGWGAQVLEHPGTGIVIFADVDLSPEEVRGDFAHEPLSPRAEFGTVGLWCALHGEAFLGAGLHHLEATFDFTAARAQLATLGITTMKPFTDLPHLRQCFTTGERWQVDPQRIEVLVRDGVIGEDQAHEFARSGAIGSHLEILERNLGFKGFNQHGVSEIIAATDPRRQLQRT